MKLLKAEFVTSAAAGGTAEGIPRDGLPQIAFAGRSNVGKSSLINALARRRIARTSAAPGKTRLANIYRATLEGGATGAGRWSLYLVDLPGYGYARGGGDAAAELAAIADGYFRTTAGMAADTTRALRLSTLLIVDSRHPDMQSDRAAASWLESLGVRIRVVATKIDKLSRADRTRNLRELERTFGMAALPVSAESGEGLNELWQTIVKLARS